MEKKRALIIVGEVAMQDFLSKHLSQMGLCCSIADSAHAGLKLLEDFQPDLILVNDRLPDASGREVVHHLKTNGQKDIPLITLSYDQRKPKARKVRHLTRPIRLSLLKQFITDFLKTGDKQWQTA